MIEKKLVEKDVEFTVVKREKRLVEVYSFEGKDYHHRVELKEVLAGKMGDLFAEMLNFSTNACNLVRHTNMCTFKNNARSLYNADKLYMGGELLEYFNAMEELIMIYSQVND